MNPQDTIEDQQPLAVVDEVITKPLERGALVAITEEDLRRRADRMILEEQHFELSQRRAKMFSISGLFEEKGIAPGSQQGVARAMVKIELGESMGFSAAEALQGIYIINGQTAIASALRAGRMQAAGFDWVLQWHGTHQECKGCTLWLSRHGKPLISEQPQVWTAPEPPLFPFCDPDGKPIIQAGHYLTMRQHESFLESDAKALLTTLWEGQKGNKVPRRASVLEKDNWKMSPRNMYFARAATNAQRFYAPAVLSVSLMSAEEAMDVDTGADPDQRQHTEILGSREAQGKVAVGKLLQMGQTEAAKKAARDFGVDSATLEAMLSERKKSSTSVSSPEAGQPGGVGASAPPAGGNSSGSSQAVRTASADSGDAGAGNGGAAQSGTQGASARAEHSQSGEVSAEERLESRSTDLRVYLHKVGPDAFGAVLVKHCASSLTDAANSPDQDFLAIVRDLEAASKAKPEAAKPAEPKRQKDFDLKSITSG